MELTMVGGNIVISLLTNLLGEEMRSYREWKLWFHGTPCASVGVSGSGGPQHGLPCVPCRVHQLETRVRLVDFQCWHGDCQTHGHVALIHTFQCLVLMASVSVLTIRNTHNTCNTCPFNSNPFRWNHLNNAKKTDTALFCSILSNGLITYLRVYKNCITSKQFLKDVKRFQCLILITVFTIAPFKRIWSDLNKR